MKNQCEQTQSFWVSLDVLAWERFAEGGALCEDSLRLLRRPYELLDHVEKKLTGFPTELDLVDAVTTLKGAAFHRKDALERLYKLKHLPISDLPKDPLERLAFLGILKPMVFRNLVDVRNYVEHQDAKPPGMERGKELAEYVWYFLRSTDPLVKVIANSNLLEDPESEEPTDYWISIGNSPLKDWTIEFRGWLPSPLLSASPKRESCTIKGTFIYAKDNPKPGAKGRAFDDIYVNGKIVGPREAMVRLYRHYFSES